MVLVSLATFLYYESVQRNTSKREQYFMKLATGRNSRRATTDFSYLLRLATTLEGAYGAGVMTADDKQETQRAGWTTKQLLALSRSKSVL